MNALIGILSLQGAFKAHELAVRQCGASTLQVRTPDDLDRVDALVMPGGESTTMSHLLTTSNLFDPIAKRLSDDMPVFGTCAGMILLAQKVHDARPDQRSFAALDIDVRRNAYGRQVDSFECDLSVTDLERSSMRCSFVPHGWSASGKGSRCSHGTTAPPCSCVRVE